VREHRREANRRGIAARLTALAATLAEEVERFAQRVRKQIGVPVELVDERLTSWKPSG